MNWQYPIKRLLLFIMLPALNSCNDVNENLFHVDRIQSVQSTSLKGKTGIDGPFETDSTVFQQKIKAIFKKANSENYNTHYAFLADLGLHSGNKRLFVVNLSSKKVVASGLVTHGSSTTYLRNGKRKYSNTCSSLCSSLGMYKVGAPYQGQFGLAYKLYGLSKENSNAYTRAIVLHSHSCVPDTETTNPICQSWGCPTVSPAFLKKLRQYIDSSEKPLLLYIFDSGQ